MGFLSISKHNEMVSSVCVLGWALLWPLVRRRRSDVKLGEILTTVFTFSVAIQDQPPISPYGSHKFDKVKLNGKEKNRKMQLC